MTKTNKKAIRNTSYLLLILLCFVACEDDLINIDTDFFVGNRSFINKDTVLNISFSNEDITRIETSDVEQYLFGVYHDNNFGTLKASFVSQLGVPSNVEYYTREIHPDSIVIPTLDDVVLYIPYQYTSYTDSQGYTRHELDSVFGIHNKVLDNYDTYGRFRIQVYELQTFLNSLDPTNPSKENIFYTDKEYPVTLEDELTEVIDFEPTARDTVTYIERKIGNVLYDIDTITLSDNRPRIAIRLDKDFFRTKFLEKFHAEGEEPVNELASQAEFIRYFKGLYLKTISESPGAIISLKLTDAFVDVYYTNLIKKISTDENLDTIKEVKKFDFRGITLNSYEYVNRSTKNNSKLYIQGTIGSQANIKILENDQLEIFRELSKTDGRLSWLINEASLRFYIDENFMETSTDTVFKLFLYKKKADYNSQILDYITSQSPIDGKLQKDDDLSTDSRNIYYYKFRITDYITDLLGDDNTNAVDDFRLKVYSPGDLPRRITDTIVSSINWNPRGVVIYGGNQTSPIHDATGILIDPKRPVLKINYSARTE